MPRDGRWGRDTVDVALVVPLSGPAGMFGPSCEACAELAVEHLNARGGILGRRVRLHPVDAGAALPVLADEVDRLVSSGAVDGVVGWHLSNARNAITPRTAGRVPYVYTTFYEGGESNDGVFMVGETPEQQLFPALRWLRQVRGIRRWCVVGNDYVWPRMTARAMREFIANTDLDYVGETFLPLGGRDFRAALRQIHASTAQGVLVLMVGADNAAFNRAFARARLDESRLRLSMMIGEDVLFASGSTATHDLYTASGYFESVVSPDSMSFGAEYQRRFGATAPSLNNIGESCYEGLLLFASLAEAARSLDLRDIRASSHGVTYQGPRGEVHVEGAHTTQPVFLAGTDDLDFSVLTQLDGDG
ncbi:substrate-binding domain-containing protein [Mycolicibacterium madagascariense]|nr:substrate-binding domain-containing protein [Mycolicibacterium madagascariense]MCV7012923.1 substrate-binding domain-containing protein [Mycolicibacterium madagascariense]